MHTVTLEINNNSAMRAIKSLASKKELRIISTDEMHSPAFPGTPLSISAMKEWIGESEVSPTISLKAAKSEWARRKKHLQGLAR